VLLARAAASVPPSLRDERQTVTTAAALAARGWTEAEVRSQLCARRWRRIGRAIVRHNGMVTPAEERQVALVNCGPRAVLTAFTAAALHGLTGWERDQVHVLVPRGARVFRASGLAMRVHYTGDWPAVEHLPARRLHSAAPALVLAAGTFARPRPACGLLAAGVQQRLVTASRLLDALTAAPRVRHRSLLLAAVRDIECGAEALSEIDFVRLCRRHGLPRPALQTVRQERSGRRRYLDAQWERSDGQTVGVEVDGAIHLAVSQWVDDQLRQNELVLRGTLLLRYPSVVVRTEPRLVAAQLRRALGL
jgi:hypothetical protein